MSPDKFRGVIVGMLIGAGASMISSVFFVARVARGLRDSRQYSEHLAQELRLCEEGKGKH